MTSTDLPLSHSEQATLAPPRGLVRATLLFIAAFAALHGFMEWLHADVVQWDTARWWPIGVFYPNIPGVQRGWTVLAFAPLVLLTAERALRLVWGRERALWWLLLLFALTVAGALVAGGVHGVEGPLMDPRYGGIQYWHDAVKVDDAGAFLASFNERQTSLMVHSRTHPPGAVLVYWLGRHLFGGSALLTSLALTLTSAWLTFAGLRRMLPGALEPAVRNRAAAAVLLLPAMQIYLCSTLDALIAGLLTFAVGVACSRRLWSPRERPRAAAVAAGGIVGLAAWLTFIAPAILGVLAVYELRRRRRPTATALATLTAAGLIAALSVASGADWWEAFRTAAHIESPGGFMAIEQPVTYVMTRIEDIAEVLFFLGPVALWLYAKTARRSRAAEPDDTWADQRALCLGALLVVGVLLLAGVWRTGETARATLFALPLLALPLARVAATRPALAPIVMTLFYAQAILMQTVGDYFW